LRIGHGWAPRFGEERQKDRTRIHTRARRLRGDMTASEKQLWRMLRLIKDVTFRRQVAIDAFVYDFGCFGARLLIELDRSVHRLPDVRLRDAQKDVCAAKNGFCLLRLTNDDVWRRPDWVMDQVRAWIAAPHPPTPSPQGRGGDGV
jgi:cyclase